ncbi:SDR family oxidoreductase [Amycolatopsis thermophila]|uniref:Citronellol/citronellal dehydrogenase n=1 Tax=Amycolatopsis thermophila TaxID=206084 RepID=A0ABU0F5V9_9PSEU|nr:NAD(P)-dependent oxidoreductase [Amycolatopsis thermophila]MDQ0382506.1 citronellol/citronellal dehydrogenase [Amycolatopsis thermophila]
MPRDLSGQTVIMSGGSRGIGLAIAVRAGRDGANVALLAKTGQPHPKLPGTVHAAAREIERAGGNALPIVGDVRDDDAVLEAVERTALEFGSIDVCVNNASAIDLSATADLTMKRYDLMQDVNARGTFLLSKACLPHLRKSANPHILNLSPPLSLSPRWAGRHLGYTIAKYGMSLCTLGLAHELAGDGIAVNSLWPRTTIATAAVEHVVGDNAMMERSRSPQIMADAAYAILTRDARRYTGNFYLDDAVLEQEGITDFSRYALGPSEDLAPDLFLD